jgi:superfamily II DNA or RNA helicase
MNLSFGLSGTTGDEMLDYAYQDEAVSNALATNLGQIILPTGTGKSRIEARIIEEMIRKTDCKFGLYVIATPRILLTNQLMKTVVEHIAKGNKTPVMRAIVHSGADVDFGKQDDIKIEQVIERSGAVNTTNPKELRIQIQKAQIADTPLIICATYHSLDVVAIAAHKADVRINVIINDEAHNIVSKEFFASVEAVKREADAMFSFTATQRTTASDTGCGMNNEQFYGQVICTRSPREMIDQGYIVRPRLHLVHVDDEESADASAVISAFQKHREVAGENAKLLINCNDSEQLTHIVESKEFTAFVNTEMQAGKNFKLFYICSATGYNGDKDRNKEQFVKDLNSHNGPALVLHIRMLTEGIDVPDMTGIMVMRSMNKSRFLQSLGRATRLTTADRSAFLNGQYGPGDLKSMTKPYAYVVVPVFTDSGDDLQAEIISYVEQLRDHGFDPREDVIVSSERGTEKFDDIDTACEPEPKTLKSLYNALIKIEHFIEDEESAALRQAQEQELQRLLDDDKIEDFALALVM